MLNTISWQQFITAILLIAAAWYAYIGLTYYRSELVAFLKNMQAIKNQLPPADRQASNSVMGIARPEPDNGLNNPEELIFGPVEPDDIRDTTLPNGPADDLLAEGAMLMTAFSETGTKQDFLLLLRLLIDKYEINRDEISLESVIASLQISAKTKLSFEITHEEWPSSWMSADYQKIN